MYVKMLFDTHIIQEATFVTCDGMDLDEHKDHR